MLYIRLFSGFSFEIDGKSIPSISGERAKSILFKLLLSCDKDIERSVLAGLIWPESSEQQARTNLRRELHALRKHHPVITQCLQTTRSTLRWEMPDAVDYDVGKFHNISDQFSTTGERTWQIKLGLELLDLVAGDLLPGYEDQWIVDSRQRYAKKWLVIAENVLELLKASQRESDYVAVANQILLREPLLESVYLKLMHSHMRTGDAAMALHVYHSCSSVLRAELNVEPSDELVDLFRSLKVNATEKNSIAAPFRLHMMPMPTPLIGRDQVLKKILSEFNSIKKGFCMIHVQGEAGVGKTRLVEEVLRSLSTARFAISRASCYAAAGDVGLSVLNQWFNAKWFARLFHSVDKQQQVEIARVFPQLSVDLSNSDVADAAVRSQQQVFDNSPSEGLVNIGFRHRLFEALTKLITIHVEGTEVDPFPARILYVDDIQWCDLDTLEFLAFLFSQPAMLPVAIVATERYTARPLDSVLSMLLLQLQRNRQLTTIELPTLPNREMLTLAQSLSKNYTQTPFAAAELSQISNWSKGNPFYLVESMRHFMSSGASLTIQSNDKFPIAPEIAAILQERILALPRFAQSLLRYASVIGRSFPLSLVERLNIIQDNSLIDTLDALWATKFITEVANGEYDFTHDCIKEICYESLPLPSRRRMHALVADALTNEYASTIESAAVLIATHWEQAGDYKLAYQWYWNAIVHARRTVARRELVALIDKCLHFIHQYPELITSTEKQMELLLFKSHALSMLDGFGKQREIGVCEQIEALIPSLENSKIRFSALGHLRLHASFSGEMGKAQLCTQLQIDIAQSRGAIALQVEAHRSMAFVQFQLGQFNAMLKTCEAGVAQVQVAEEAGQIDAQYPDWSVSMLRVMHMYALHMAGRTTDAEHLQHVIGDIGGSRGDDHQLGLLLNWMDWHHQLVHQIDETQVIGLELVRIGQRSFLTKIRSMGLYLCAWVHIQNGRWSDGHDMLTEAITLIESIERYMPVLGWYIDLAQVCNRLGKSDAALAMLERSENAARHGLLPLYNARRMRVKANILSSDNNITADTILALYREASNVAVSQYAMPVQLRCISDELRYRLTRGLGVEQIYDGLKVLVEQQRLNGASLELKYAIESLNLCCRATTEK